MMIPEFQNVEGLVEFDASAKSLILIKVPLPKEERSSFDYMDGPLTVYGVFTLIGGAIHEIADVHSEESKRGKMSDEEYLERSVLPFLRGKLSITEKKFGIGDNIVELGDLNWKDLSKDAQNNILKSLEH